MEIGIIDQNIVIPGHHFRMVDKELPVVHPGEHLNVSIGLKGTQVPCLWFCDKGLLGSIPIILSGIHP